MEVLKIEKNKQKQVELLNKKNLRVCAYARVSSIERNGGVSVESQKKYYENKIKSNPNWIFKGVYSDEGISGSSTKNRLGFQRLVLSVVNHDIDFVLTKSISRFARNTMDALKYIRLFKDNNVGILFEEENINTMSMESELVITILSSIAQQEIENLSYSIKYGKYQNFKEGKITARFAPYGYTFDKETGNFIINKKEAEVVKLIYNEYIKLKSFPKLIDFLAEKNIKTKQNKDRWGSSTLREMLLNEVYLGNLIIGKYYSVNPIDQTIKKNEGQANKYLIKNHHEPIIDKDTFDKVQLIIKSNREKYWKIKCNENNYLYKGKIRCGYCGYVLRRTAKKNGLPVPNISYKCSSNAHSRAFCKNLHYYKEELIDEMITKAYEEIKKIKFKQKYIKENLKTKELFANKLIKAVYIGKDDNPYYMRIILKDNDIIKYIITHDYKDKEFQEILKIRFKKDFLFYENVNEKRVALKLNHTYIEVLLERMY